MNHLPKMLLSGKAGSGKDTVAEILRKRYGAAPLAMADPMKRFTQAAFQFSERQLWGPSDERNAVDPRYSGNYQHLYWNPARDFASGTAGHDWIRAILGLSEYEARSDYRLSLFHQALILWIDDLRGAPSLSPRVVLQTLGTEWGRRHDPEMWIRKALADQHKLLTGGYTYKRDLGLVQTDAPPAPLAVVTDGRFPNEVLAFKAAGAVAVRIVDPAAKSAPGVAGHTSESLQDSVPDWWFDFVLVNDKTRGLHVLEGMVESMMRSLTGTPVVRPSQYTSDYHISVTSIREVAP